MADPRLTILYDAECGFCRWSLDKVLAWDRRRAVRPVAIQSEEGRGLLHDVAEHERLRSWHLVLPTGEVQSAGAAAVALAEVLPGGRALAWVFRTFPGATERAYVWVARNRGRLGRLLRVDASCELRR